MRTLVLAITNNSNVKLSVNGVDRGIDNPTNMVIRPNPENTGVIVKKSDDSWRATFYLVDNITIGGVQNTYTDTKTLTDDLISFFPKAGGSSGRTDPDAALFLTAASVSNDNTTYNTGTPQQIAGKGLYSATSTLFKTGKTFGWIPKMAAFWPVVIDTQAAHQLNAVNPVDSDAAFRLSPGGTVTHSSLGITGDSHTGYLDTHFNPSTQIGGQAPFSWGINISATLNNGGIDMGLLFGASAQDISTNSGNQVGVDYSQKQIINPALANSYYEGFFQVNFDGTILNVYKDGELIITDTGFTQNHPNGTFFLLCRNHNGTPLFFSGKTFDFAYISNQGLSEAEILSINGAVKTFNAALGRSVPFHTIIYGDSIAAEYPVPAEDGWPNIYCAAKGTLQVNFAQYGTTLLEVSPVLANSMYARATAGQIPKYVYGMQNLLINYLTNDVLNNTANYSTANVQIQLGAIIDIAISQGWPLGKIYVQGPSYFEQAARDSYIGTNSVTVGRTQQGHSDINEAARTECGIKDVGFIDIYTLVRDNGAMANVGSDGLHLNITGHALVATEEIRIAA